MNNRKWICCNRWEALIVFVEDRWSSLLVKDSLPLFLVVIIIGWFRWRSWLRIARLGSKTLTCCSRNTNSRNTMINRKTKKCCLTITVKTHSEAKTKRKWLDLLPTTWLRGRMSAWCLEAISNWLSNRPLNTLRMSLLISLIWLAGNSILRIHITNSSSKSIRITSTKGNYLSNR